MEDVFSFISLVFSSYKFFVTIFVYVQMLRSLWMHIVERTTVVNDKCLSENTES